MIVRIEGQIYRVLAVESRAGAAKMGGLVKTKLMNVKSDRMWEPHFRPQEKLENLEPERRMMEFPYAGDDTCTFMRPDTFEQIEVPSTTLEWRRGSCNPGWKCQWNSLKASPSALSFQTW
jgi:elongation factor P